MACFGYQLLNELALGATVTLPERVDCVELPEIECKSGDVFILVSDVFEEILLVQLGEYGIQLGLDVSTVAERYPL